MCSPCCPCEWCVCLICACCGLRWLFLLLTFAVLSFGSSVLVFSATWFSVYRPTFDDLRNLRSPEQLVEEEGSTAIAGILIFGIVLGVVVVVLSVLGLIGGFCLNKKTLVVYSALMGALAAGLLIGLNVAWKVHRDDVKVRVINLYNEFAKRLYDRPKFQDTVTLWIDDLQENYKCCGIKNTSTDARNHVGVNLTDPDLDLTAIQTIRFWLESTRWGEARISASRKNSSASLLWTPTSCCRKKSQKCSMGLYKDLAAWDWKKVAEWQQKIYTDLCGAHLFEPTGGIIAFLTIAALSITGSVVSAVLLVICA